MHVAAKLVELNCLCVTVLCVMRYAYFALCTLLLGTRNNLNSKKRVPGLFDRVSPTPGGELVRAQRGQLCRGQWTGAKPSSLTFVRGFWRREGDGARKICGQPAQLGQILMNSH